MNLFLHRGRSLKGATISPLYVDGYTFGYVLEDEIREFEGEPVEKWKVKGQTAIPKGIYPITITFSQRFQRELPLVNNVPGFSGIRIHPGNVQADTEGCLLVGYDKTSDVAIGRSRVACEALLDQIRAELAGGGYVSITIENPAFR